jgi:subtilisin family serine protease
MKNIAGMIIFSILVLPWNTSSAGELSRGLSEALGKKVSNTMVPVIVRMSVQTDLPRETRNIPRGERRLQLKRVIQSLKKTALKRSQGILDFIKKEQLSGRVDRYTPYWIFNGLAVRATPDVIEQIALRDDVGIVTEDFSIPRPSFSSGTPLQTAACDSWNIEKIRAPAVWNRGYDGSGVVVGIIDTGVDVTHPDLADSFRGGANSWFDPHGEHTFPVDAAGPATGHGTHVAGIIVGGDTSGAPIGVAPGAQWIAARIWNDAGDEALSSDVHSIFQWFMDPDGDPETDDFPDVINNSWGFTLLDAFPWCLPELQDDIRAWREAGIIPVFSAGNFGPWFFSGESPGNYPETIAVGASNPLDAVALFSSRGPGNCDRRIFPDMVAPGVTVCSSAPGGRYHSISGTSQAAPHVVGTIALMLSADPALTVEEIESKLKITAQPVGLFRPNFTSGWGRLDALKAVSSVIP